MSFIALTPLRYLDAPFKKLSRIYGNLPNNIVGTGVLDGPQQAIDFCETYGGIPDTVGVGASTTRKKTQCTHGGSAWGPRSEYSELWGSELTPALQQNNIIHRRGDSLFARGRQIASPTIKFLRNPTRDAEDVVPYNVKYHFSVGVGAHDDPLKDSQQKTGGASPSPTAEFVRNIYGYVQTCRGGYQPPVCFERLRI